MPGRKYEAQSGYRYGFNGKEKDKDINNLTAYDYGFRIYNPGIGKFLSVDPMTKNFSFYSSYLYARNSPIRLIDNSGLSGEDPPLWYATLQFRTIFSITSANQKIIESGIQQQCINSFIQQVLKIPGYEFSENPSKAQNKGSYGEFLMGLSQHEQTEIIYDVIFSFTKITIGANKINQFDGSIADNQADYFVTIKLNTEIFDNDKLQEISDHIFKVSKVIQKINEITDKFEAPAKIGGYADLVKAISDEEYNEILADITKKVSEIGLTKILVNAGASKVVAKSFVKKASTVLSTACVSTP